MMSACSGGLKKASDPSDHSHQHSSSNSQYTLFSDSLEFFIEHEPLEAGEESQFLVHVTDLPSYKPCLAGHVTISIDGVSVTSGQPVTPGIFNIPFIPKNGGEYPCTYTFETGASNETVTGHVHIYADHDAMHAAEEAPSGHSHSSDTEGEITFFKEQAWNNDFIVKKIEPAPFASVIHTSGEILAVPGMKKNLSATHGGMVLFREKNLVQGSAVKQDQQLFTISSERMIDHNLQLQYLESKNSYEKSKSDYLRHQSLFKQGAISQRQFLATRSEYLKDSLLYHSLNANTTGQGIQVHAPISGTIHELNVSEGQFIETGQNLAVISSNRNLLIRADLSQQYFDRILDIETANFRPAYTEQIYSIEEVRGKLLATGRTVAENDHYLPVIFEVENDGSLLEGAFTDVYLKSAQKSNALTLPVTALLEDQGDKFVFVQVTGESYTKRSVTMGNHDGIHAEIISGLEPGERVVTRGVMLVKAASMVTGVVGHGHTH